MSSRCRVDHDMVPCQNTWYWFPLELLSQVCGARLILRDNAERSDAATNEMP